MAAYGTERIAGAAGPSIVLGPGAGRPGAAGPGIGPGPGSSGSARWGAGQAALPSVWQAQDLFIDVLTLRE